jgi:hypothetical protein
MALFLRFTFSLVALLGTLALQQATAQIYYLDLSRQTLSLPNRTIHVEQVVDGRPGRPTIGLVYRGLDNRPAAVMFRNGLEADLTTFLKKQLPARPTDRAVVLCLRQLRVSEQLNGMTEAATADLAADVYAHLPDGYHFMRSTGARISKRALETTALHQAHVATLFQQCLEQLTDADWTQAQTAPTRTLQQLPNDVPTAGLTTSGKSRLPAILREQPRRGVYFTFEQFLTNQPDTLTSFQLEVLPLRKWGGTTGKVLWWGVPRMQPTVVEYQGQRQPLAKTAWGFSDGQQMYVQYEKLFYPLTRQANFFTFIGEKPVELEYLRAVNRAQAKAGMVGAATVQMPDHTGEPTPYAVDMRTGQSAPFPDPMRTRPARPDTAYIYLYRQADALGTPVAVFLEGREVGTLRPNEYLELPWPYYARMMRLCLGLPTPNSCQLLVPDVAKASYLRIQTGSSAATMPIWRWISATQGEADLDALDKLKAAETK